ncbi:hypothetical protein BH24ACT3_BH24ACT3_10930 [soil metagenome]
MIVLRSGAGVVAQFDDHRGYGTVRDAGGEEWFFHCIAIADGTRTIEEGAQVTFDLVAGRLGRWEAASVRGS